MYAFIPSVVTPARSAPTSSVAAVCPARSVFVGGQIRSKHAQIKSTTTPKMSMETLSTMIQIAEGGGMRVTFPAYLAIFLGTLIPVGFLIILYIQSEARESGKRDVLGDE